MGWFTRLFRRPDPPKAEEPDNRRAGYRRLPGPSKSYRCIEFFDLDRGVRRTIVDDKGNILNFPGIEDEQRIRVLLGNRRLAPVTRYYADVEQRPDGQYVMYWTVQPDGRYWADDGGFGMEDDEEVVLCALMDGSGHFTSPFRLRKVGRREYPIDGNKS